MNERDRILIDKMHYFIGHVTITSGISDCMITSDSNETIDYAIDSFLKTDKKKRILLNII